METMKQRLFPCEDATDEEISRAILLTSLGRGNHTKKLQKMTCRVSGAEVPWDTVEHLDILGSGASHCNNALKHAGMYPGVYTNRRGTWLLLIHPEEANIQRVLDRCGVRLRSLEAYHTQLRELDISPCPLVAGLRIWHNEGLQRLSGLEQLQQLTWLDLSRCSGLRELHGLEHLQQLTWLDLSECSGLTELHGLEHLQQLTKLYFHGCSGLTELPEGIRGLKSLRKLDLSEMKLKTLPDWLPEIAEGFEIKNLWVNEGKEKANVCLYETIVEDMEDMSIFEQPYEVIAEWFRNRSQGKTRPLNEIKVVFLGDGEAGKSHTIARLMNDGGEPDFAVFDGQSTPGIVIRNKDYTFSDRSFRVHYWDFGGQEIMHSMHRIFLTGRTMYVILLNARDDTQSDRARYWLHNVRSFAPDAPVLLVLNKIDQNENASVDEPDLRSRHDKLTQVVKLSALNFSREEFNRSFTDVLLDEILKTGYLDAQWPISWTQVKDELENMATHYISGTAYQDICAKYQVDENQKPLLHWFNDLGISFCCCGDEDYALEDYVILRPDWITNALYIILFNPLEGAQNGLIPHKSIYDLLKNAHNNPAIRCTMPQARYTAGDIQYVLGIMRKFSLSFQHGDNHEFLPMLCQQNSTVNVQYYRQDSEVLEFTMEFDYLPNNLLHRLMVERHAELDMENVWRTGARFCHRELGYSAVVVIDGNALRFFIRHTDPMHRPNTYLTMLKANVDRIMRKMGLNPPSSKLIYKLDGRQDTFDYEMLKIMQEAGERDIFSVTWRRRIPLRDIFNQSAPDGMADQLLLLNAIRSSCSRMQDEPHYRLVRNPDGHGYANGSGMEDLRNRRLRDDLLGKDYSVADQSQRGTGRTGAGIGEVDLLLMNDQNEPWTIIEALRVSDGTKTEWNSHLDKLLSKYNTHGLPALYLLTYVDANPASFDAIWLGYQTHIKQYDPKTHLYCENSFTDLNDDNSPLYIKTAKCLYSCGGDPITVYHIFARIPTQDE